MTLHPWINIQIKEIFPGRYISFKDERRINDISSTFHAAIENELSNLLENDIRFVCITHSTGGPVIRDWSHRYYGMKLNNSRACLMSHLS
jgi:hypothetical protein